MDATSQPRSPEKAPLMYLSDADGDQLDTEKIYHNSLHSTSMYRKFLYFCCPLLRLCQKSKGNRLSCRERCWIFFKGAFVFKITMLIFKLSILFALMYAGVSDHEPKIRINDPPSTSSDSVLSTCPYVELTRSPKVNMFQKVLLNMKWFLTMPILIAKRVFRFSPSAQRLKYYNCSLSLWTSKYIYSVWTNKMVENPRSVPKEFRIRISFKELKILHDLLRTLTERFDQEGFTYFLYGQTLVDAYRHHGMAKWGDSINIAVPFSLKKRIRDVLEPLKENGYILKSGNQEWYFFSRSSLPIRKLNHKWPHIEISFYGENMRQIWDKNYKYAYNRRYERNVIFPLIKRPFWNLWLNSPANSSAVLAGQDISKCVSPTHDHRLGQWIAKEKVKSISCSYLYDSVPLVFRTQDKDGEVEILRVRDHALQAVIITN